jgi:hypothetical protein
LTAVDGTVNVADQSPEESSDADAVDTGMPAPETSATAAEVDGNDPPKGHGVTEPTPTEEPAGVKLGENASEPDGTAGFSSTTRALTISGKFSPVIGSVVWMPPGVSSNTWSEPRFATNTSPDPST